MSSKIVYIVIAEMEAGGDPRDRMPPWTSIIGTAFSQKGAEAVINAYAERHKAIAKPTVAWRPNYRANFERGEHNSKTAAEGIIRTYTHREEAITIKVELSKPVTTNKRSSPE